MATRVPWTSIRWGLAFLERDKERFERKQPLLCFPTGTTEDPLIITK
jgi:hypothetical protein